MGSLAPNFICIFLNFTSKQVWQVIEIYGYFVDNLFSGNPYAVAMSRCYDIAREELSTTKA